MQWKLFFFFCRNLYYFKFWCIADHQNVQRLTSHNINYIGCVFHCIEASEAVVPQLLMSAKQNSNMITVGLKWNGYHWNFFTFFHWQIQRSKSCHTNFKNFPIVYTLCYVLKWITQRCDAPSCGEWQSPRSQTNHAPSCSLSPTLLPCCQAIKRVLMIFIIFIYMMGLESHLW